MMRMDDWLTLTLVLLAILLLAPLVMSIVALVQVSGLKRSLAELRARMEASLEPGVGAAPATEASAAPAPALQAAGAKTEPPAPAGQSKIPPRDPAQPPLWTRIRGGVEANIGGHIAVWIGAVALLVGGGFFVKYSIDQGYLTPTVRVVLAVLGGIALIVASQFVRRRSVVVASGLAAGGLGFMYAGFLAATRLYGLIPGGVGFAAMAITSGLAIALALRLGPIVAYVGLLGGYAVPALVPASEPNVLGLVVYLLIFGIALTILAIRKQWLHLVQATAIAVLVWSLLLVVMIPRGPGEDWLWHALYVVVSLGAVYAAAGASARYWRGLMPNAAATAYAAHAVALALLALGTGQGGFATVQWIVLAALGAAAMVVEREDRRYPFLGWVGAAVPAVALCVWKLGFDPVPARTPWLEAMAFDPGRYWWLCLVFGAGYAALALAAGWRAALGGRWGVLSGLSALAYFLLAWLGLETDPPVGWGTASLIVAGLFLAALTAWLRIEEPEGAPSRGMTAALAVAVTGFVSLAVPLAFDHEWIAVAWGVEVAALAWIDYRLGPVRVSLWGFDMPVLRRLAAALALGCILQLSYVTGILLPRFASDTILWVWVLYGHGGPVLAMVLGAWLLLLKRDDWMARFLEWAAIWLGLYTLCFLIFVFWQGLGILDLVIGLPETGSIAAAAMLYALGLDWLSRVVRRQSLVLSTPIIAYGALTMALIGGPLLVNPWIYPIEVGTRPVLNLLAVGYGMPLATAALLARRMRQSEPRLALAAAVVALVQLFFWVTLEVRHAFHPAAMDVGGVEVAENYAYSAAWLVLGIALTLAGVWRRALEIRVAGMAILLFAILKVFLYDASALTGLYRVASFIGLGFSLIGLGYVYQRFVAPRARAAD